jgi:hypothetical protein
MAGQTSDAISDARTLVDRQANGLSADCLFQQWPKDRQMQAYRALNEVSNDSTGNLPTLTLSYSERGRHLTPDSGRCAPEDVPKPVQQRQSDSRRTERANRPSDSGPGPREIERLAHPERPAERIEELAKRALDGKDERAKLDLRKELEKLANEPNKEFRDKVLQRMVEDGTYLANPMNGKPHVEVKRDERGRPESITFSKNLGIYKTEIPLNKSLEEQVTEAQKNYMDSLGKITGGLGKFDTNATMKAYDIMTGADPTNVRWFMLHRQDQGRPLLDRN